MFFKNANISNELKIALERNPMAEDGVKKLLGCVWHCIAEVQGVTVNLRNGNFLILHSHNLLRKYKNSVHQEAGIHKDMLE